MSWSVPRQIAARERHLHYFTPLSQWPFLMVFGQNHKKRSLLFKMLLKKCSDGLSGYHCPSAKHLEASCYFIFSFATAVASTQSARARSKKIFKKSVNLRSCKFCAKHRTFFKENGSKSTHLVATGKLAWRNNSPRNNTESKNNFIPYSKKPILRERGVVPSSSFFSTLRPERDKLFWTVRNASTCATSSNKL